MTRSFWHTVVLAFLVAALTGGVAFADSITGGASWQNFPATLDENGIPYFDSPSMDGSRLGLGYYLSGFNGMFAADTPGLQPQWYGTALGNPDLNFYFASGLGALSATMTLEISGYSLLNEFGWYDVASPEVLHPVFSPSDTTGARFYFTPSPLYGYYLKSGSGETYYTQSSINPGQESAHQHFAVFGENLASSGSESFWVGLEDLPLGLTGMELQGDYNDMVIHITPAPEPSAAALCGLGLLMLLAAAGLTRCRRRTEHTGIVSK